MTEIQVKVLRLELQIRPFEARIPLPSRGTPDQMREADW